MKRLITSLLCAAMLQFSCPPPVRSQGVNTGPCMAIVLFVVVTGAILCVRSCRPRYKCVTNPDTGEKWCSLMSRRAAESGGLTMGTNSWKDIADCQKLCTNVVKGVALASYGLEESFVIAEYAPTPNGPWSYGGSVIMDLDSDEERSVFIPWGTNRAKMNYFRTRTSYGEN
jgi:hypothetical protein